MRAEGKATLCRAVRLHRVHLGYIAGTSRVHLGLLQRLVSSGLELELRDPFSLVPVEE